MGRPKKNPDPDLDNSEDTISFDDSPRTVSDDNYIESFSELFGDGSESIRVQLYRIEPMYDDTGERCDGFLRYLRPGDDPGTVSEEYGGRLYELRQHIVNPGERPRWGKQIRFRISGPPRRSAPPRAGGPPESNPTPLPSPPPSAAVIQDNNHVEGIPIGGTDEDFLKRMERIAMIKAAFPPPNDINTQLVTMIMGLKTQPTSGLDIKSIAETVSAIKEITGIVSSEKGGETSMLDIVKEGIGAFREFVEARKTGTQPQPPPQPAMGNPQLATQKPPEIPQNTAGNAVQGHEKENPTMSIQQIAEKACKTIVAGYTGSPQQTPAEVSDSLNIFLPLDKQTKPAIAHYRNQLHTAAINTLTQEYETQEDDQERFSLYFNEVFDIFMAS